MSDIGEVSDFGVSLPTTVYRVSKSRFPSMQLPPREVQGPGRFDDNQKSPGGGARDYAVLYCAASATGSFLEILATLREHLSTIASFSQTTIMDVDEREEAGALVARARNVVSERWPNEWELTSATILTEAPVFDLTSPAAVQFVRERLALTLLAMRIADLDFSHVLSDNRDLTRAISRWLWTMTSDSGEPLFSGIRYRSRFDPECICFALYENRYAVDGDVEIQPITPETPGFAEAATTLRLEIA